MAEEAFLDHGRFAESRFTEKLLATCDAEIALVSFRSGFEAFRWNVFRSSIRKPKKPLFELPENFDF